jgi:hypothetical protein
MHRFLIGGDDLFCLVQHFARGLHHVLAGARIGSQSRRLTFFPLYQRRLRRNALERHRGDAGEAGKFKTDTGVRANWRRLVDRQHRHHLVGLIGVKPQIGDFADTNAIEQNVSADLQPGH